MNGFKKMLFGEKMPDKNDPKYAERYKKEVALGQEFARKLRLDKLGAYLQKWCENHVRAYIIILFAFVIAGYLLVFFRLGTLIKNNPNSTRTINYQEYVHKGHEPNENNLIEEQNKKGNDENTPED